MGNINVANSFICVDVTESSYERFLLTSYENFIRNFSQYNSISVSEAKVKMPPPEIRKGPRDVWKYIHINDIEAGYIWFYRKKDGACAFLMDIHLYPEFRSKGFGLQLMMMLRDELLSMKVENLELSVFTQNEPAVRLYKKLGFSEIASERSSMRMLWNLSAL